jgi:hypothetical protein
MAVETEGGWGRIGLWFVSTLFALMLLEATVRVPVVYSNLPAPLPYYNAGLETRLRKLDTVLETEGRVDVLFAGSSVIRTNFRPSVFDRAVKRAIGVDVVSFNAGLSAINPDSARFYLEKIWLDRARPRVVVQGVRLYGFKYDSAAEDDSRIKKGRLEALWTSGRWWDSVSADLIYVVRLSQYQGTLEKSLEQLYQGKPLSSLLKRDGFPVNERGWEQRGTSLDEAKRRGWLKGRRPYNTELSSEPFQVGLEGIRRAAALCRERGISYVLVAVPETPFYYSEPDGPERYQHFIDMLGNLAEEERVPFIDVSDGDLHAFDDDSYFSDYHHMLPKGADRFTELLAAELAPLLVEPLAAD